MIARAAVAVLLAVAVALAPAQKRKSSAARSDGERGLTARQRQLVELQRSIQQRERALTALVQKERATQRTIAELQQLLERQRRYVRMLEDEIAELDRRQQQLLRTRHGYGSALDYELDRIRRLALVLAAADSDDDALDTAIIGTALRRLEQRARTLKRAHDSTGSALDKLQQYRAARTLLAHQQQREQQRLERLLALRTQLLDKFRRDRHAIERELQQLRKSAATIQRSIERLARSEGKSAPAPTGKLPSLSAPVRGAILRGYGEYRHPATGAKAFNTGIDIAVPVGSPVRAAAAGTVVSVQWLPAMNTVVIIDHGNGVRTVYGNLDKASVRAGSRVSAGQTIGTSGETLSGAFVHFELWRGAERLDPTFVVR